MNSFSERHGYKEVRSIVQREDLDEETRRKLWNLVALLPEGFESLYNDLTERHLLEALWLGYLEEVRDEMPRDQIVWMRVKDAIFEHKWHEVFDLLELLIKRWDRYGSSTAEPLKNVFVKALNDLFESQLVGYRFIGHEITPVDSTAESEAIQSALFDTEEIAGARHALDRAVELLADRSTPDYPNSIKESISAVEAVVRKLTGENMLGPGLARLERGDLSLHPALRAAWVKMYAWTSDEDGIRHGGLEAANADQALAKYVLITCSAFVSYLIEAARKGGIV
ncbi:AbiJ-NTD4 domain-containing protein [Microbacterium sp. zg.Y909]|uniref:AbiJ-NTD4 domain-containing protein n=1 Tax=Microbacterium sp. zg.Y909 TaxID=2969413 RepID=UPI00214B0B50|nr:hypothetical protein [Microbacterium sp. zg.Y909]MCR2825012.1 hypothetical protein [Microbacterium sp. zg.Y909]